MPFFGGTKDVAYPAEQYVVPTGPAQVVYLHHNEVILTAGSDLDIAAVSSGNLGNPWPKIIQTYVARLFKGAAWRPNNLREIANRNIGGNYGAITSVARFSFRGREFGGVGSMPTGSPGTWRDCRHPTYNVAAPIVYGLRDEDPNQKAQLGELTNVELIQVAPTGYVPASAASLQEVLL